ncbi:MAG: CHASE2 domain-containing protein, partial [Rhizobiaceae bacterium]|nr:CHASE2 domain-containing protein [Rhizobiaceae bacterium]
MLLDAEASPRTGYSRLFGKRKPGYSRLFGKRKPGYSRLFGKKSGRSRPSDRNARRRKSVSAGVLAILLLALARIAVPEPFLDLRHVGFDAMQRLAPRPYREAPVRVIDIDDASLGRIGQWPWSRETVARLTEALQEKGAAAIAFDVLFAESDRTSPRALFADLERRGIALGDAGTPVDPAILPDNDEILAEVIGRGRTVTGFALTAETNAVRPEVKPGFAVLGEDPSAGLDAYSGAAITLPLL